MEIKTLDLSFCSDKAHNVVNSEAKELIINRLKKYDISINSKRAFILNSKSIYFLEKTQHIISIKSSGTNYYLFFTNINNINYCFYIDRKIKDGYTYPRIISVKYGFDDVIFKDTLFDGELVKHKNNNDSWMFLITDIILHNGAKLKCNIIERFNILYKILKFNYNKGDNIDICPLMVKKLFLYKDYDYLITQFIPSLSYKTNGLYFNSLNIKHANQLYLFKNLNKNNSNKKYIDNKNTNTNHFTNQHVNKVNKVNKYNHSDDDSNESENPIFRLKKTDKTEIYELYCNNRNEEYKYGLACIPNLRTSKFVKKSLENTGEIIVRCKYNTKFNKYEPISKIDDIDKNKLVELGKLENPSK